MVISDELTSEQVFHLTYVWNGSAENVCKFLKKGSKVLVEGSNLRVSLYTAKDGKPAASLEVTAERVVFLDSPEATGATNGGDEADENVPF